MDRIFWILLLLLFASVVPSTLFGADEPESVLVSSIDLFGLENTAPTVLNSERGWVLLKGVDWSQLFPTPTKRDQPQRWRLKSRYEHDTTNGPTTLQIRFQSSGTAPTFTHPWSNSMDRQATAYSNWFLLDDVFLENESHGYIEVRLIAPPRIPINGKLFNLVLEVWGEKKESTLTKPEAPKPELQLAYFSSLPTPQNGSHDLSQENAEEFLVSRESALSFSLDFVEACLVGDFSHYYRVQADNLRSLDDGTAQAKYRLAPPHGLLGIPDLATYKKYYDYRIYSLDMYRDFFPAWFEENRPWIPGENSYLFLGNFEKTGNPSPEDLHYLVFLVELTEDNSWQVVARPHQ